MSRALQQIAPLVRRSINPVGKNAVPRRNMSSGHAHDDVEETMKWKNVTAVAYVACLALGIYQFSGGHHEVHHEPPPYPYLSVRNKEFPWGPCGLFETDCKNARKDG